MTVAVRPTSEAPPAAPRHKQFLTTDERESARLADLDSYDILDTPPEEAFDRVARLAKKMFDVPIAAVSFIDAHRQWFKANAGSIAGNETARDDTFCRYVVDEDRSLVVSDASLDPRFAANPFVVEDPHVRFYAGVPLRSSNGSNIGSFCLIDVKPREFPQHDLDILRDLAQVAMDELELRQKSTSDKLTGVLSRGGFREHAGRELALARRHGDPISLIAFDVDRLAAINLTYGHSAGDAVLKGVVHACGALLRETDIVGRLGGSAFAIVVPKTAAKGAFDTAEKLRARIEKLAVPAGDHAVTATASFGVATRLASAEDIDALLATADAALRQAKAAGGNCSVAAEPPPVPSAPRHRVLKAGQLQFNGGTAAISCTVRSLSDDGAGIDVGSTVGIPRHFTLVVRADGLTRQCRVDAQTERHLEVSFELA